MRYRNRAKVFRHSKYNPSTTQAPDIAAASNPQNQIQARFPFLPDSQTGILVSEEYPSALALTPFSFHSSAVSPHP